MNAPSSPPLPALPPVLAGDLESLRFELDRLRLELDRAKLLLMRCEPTAPADVRAEIAALFGASARAGSNDSIASQESA